MTQRTVKNCKIGDDSKSGAATQVTFYFTDGPVQAHVTLWVPTSLITKCTKNPNKRNSDTITIAAWWLEKEGL